MCRDTAHALNMHASKFIAGRMKIVEGGTGRRNGNCRPATGFEGPPSNTHRGCGAARYNGTKTSLRPATGEPLIIFRLPITKVHIRAQSTGATLITGNALLRVLPSLLVFFFFPLRSYFPRAKRYDSAGDCRPLGPLSVDFVPRLPPILLFFFYFS